MISLFVQKFENKTFDQRNTISLHKIVKICKKGHPFLKPTIFICTVYYSPDCSDEYDENKSMCTAGTVPLYSKWIILSQIIASNFEAIRPPVEETASFLRALMHAHGNDFLVKVFGPKAKDALEHMGGIEHVAIALSGKFFCGYHEIL